MSAMSQDERGNWNVNYTECEGCGSMYVSRDMHEKSPRHTEWLRGQLEVEVPEQPRPRVFRNVPDRITFGDTVLCPKCKGKGKINCPGCNGVGVIPNTGV